MPCFLHRRLGPLRARAVAACAALCLGGGVGAAPPDFPGRAHVVAGAARTANGRPLARATLYLLGLPPGQYGPGALGDRTTVVTDDQGRFTWDVPADAVLLPDSGASPPSCWALAADAAGWRMTLRPAPYADTDFQRRDLREHAVRACVTRWARTGVRPFLAVTVPDVGTATLRVRGPDGRPLRGHPVEVFGPGTFADVDGAAVYDGTTDAAGGLRLRAFPGLGRLQVLVPGVGFASTGLFELLPGRDAAPVLPPLAPFARLSGTAAPALRRPGARVTSNDDWFLEHRWYRPSAPVDAAGRWTLTDVLPGEHRLAVAGGAGPAAENEVTVGPGEDADGLRLVPRPGGPPPGAYPAPAPVVVRGTVTDAAGRPAGGATVYVVFSLSALSLNEQVRATTADAAGRYAFPPLAGVEYAAFLRLVAARPGGALAEALVRPDAPGGDVRADLVLPPADTGLAVRVLRAGRPLPGAAVRLTPSRGTGLHGLGYVGTEGVAARDALAARQTPRAVTGADGRAVFTGLTPGLWDVTATAGPPSSTPDRDPLGAAQGVPVTAGRTGEFTVSVYPRPDAPVFEVRGPDGALTSGQNGGTQVERAVADRDHPTPAAPDGSGLWRVLARSRRPALGNVPGAEEPYDGAEAVFAVSGALTPAGPVVLHAFRHDPGRLRVRLEDGAGRPARGAVVIGDVFDSARYGASTDARGEAVFPDLPSGPYTLVARLADAPRLPDLGGRADLFPPDAALTGAWRVPPRTVTVRHDAETAVTLRAQPQGYVRGRLRVPGGVRGYALYSPPDHPEPYFPDPPRVRLDRTGAFVAGPFPPGPALLHLAGPTRAWEARIAVRPGRVVPVALAAGPAPSRGEEPMTPVVPSWRDAPVAATVFLADGVTPAWGARAALVVPQIQAPVRTLRADVTGRLGESGDWSDAGVAPGGPAGPAGPVLVAWLPGAAGAAVVPFTPSRPMRLVLPAPRAVSGRVTVGGRTLAGLDSAFRVVAACVGRGRLGPLLSVGTTAQADGSFVLAGLTPGTYRVQAARDRVWVSAARTATVGGRPVPALALDIPPPGGPVDLRLVDRAGRPLLGASVAVSLPAGPLTDALWPRALPADGAGALRLEGLPAGPQRLTVYPVAAGQDGTTPRPRAAVTLTIPPSGGPPVVETVRGRG